MILWFVHDKKIGYEVFKQNAFYYYVLKHRTHDKNLRYSIIYCRQSLGCALLVGA